VSWPKIALKGWFRAEVDRVEVSNGFYQLLRFGLSMLIDCTVLFGWVCKGH
jgi:hypothetical protein